MANVRKLMLRNCGILRQSEQRLEDIYNIIFSHSDNIMAQYSRGNGPEECTYREADERIGRIAAAIRSLTSAEDEYIGLYAENCVEWIILYWAILRSGNKPYLINLRQPPEFSKSILDTLGVRFVLYHQKIMPFGRSAFSYDELSSMAVSTEELSAVPFGNEFAISTSGTTLKEKICIYSGAELSWQILNIVSMHKKNIGFLETCRGVVKVLAFLPLYHIFGFEAMYLWYAFWGSTFVFLPNMSPEIILRTIRRYEVTHIFAVPLLWNAIDKSLRATLSSQDEKTRKKFESAIRLSVKLQTFSPALGTAAARLMFRDVRRRLMGESVKFCISGGSAVKESTLELINALGYGLYNGYGMSEIGITSVELSRNIRHRIRGSVGAPFDSVEYRLGEESKLFVRGFSLCKCIIIDGERIPTEGWFDTGDIMHTDERGCYYISGRISDIVFGDDGENLNPDFAEDVFVLSDVINLSVLGNEDSSRLRLVVQIPEGMTVSQREKLLADIERCNETLPRSYQVREIKYTYEPIMDELSIKVSRAYLRKAVAEGTVVLRDFGSGEEETSVSCDNSSVKAVLLELFAKVLGKPESEITDTGHFMNDLGGSSLDYFTLVGDIDRSFGITLGFDEENFGYSINDFEKIIKEMIK